MQAASAPSPSAPRPIVFDLTHLVSRLPTLSSTGIDRVDLAYAAHFAGGGRMAAALHYGLRRPHLMSVDTARKFVRVSQGLWRQEGDAEPRETFSAALEWLAAAPRRRVPKPPPSAAVANRARGARRLHHLIGRLTHERSLAVPDGAIYLNVAQHLFERPVFFRWLKQRPDLCNVFMIHDLLSIDYPEYFPTANLDLFRRRLGTAFLHADVFIVSTNAVKARLEEELRRQAARLRPIHVQPFPSPLEGEARPSSAGAPWRGHPYFVTFGTIEPRKNHLLLLHVWRKLIARDADSPRLVIVGRRGWENEQVADILDRSVALRSHILEIEALMSANLIDLLLGARALLLPSFDEGYGLPLVEALSLGTPVVASDIPVFHEVTQERATFLSPLDGPGWRETVIRLTGDAGFAAEKRAQAQMFKPPTWAGYFRDLDAFFASL